MEIGTGILKRLRERSEDRDAVIDREQEAIRFQNEQLDAPPRVSNIEPWKVRADSSSYVRDVSD